MCMIMKKKRFSIVLTTVDNHLRKPKVALLPECSTGILKAVNGTCTNMSIYTGIYETILY